MPFSHQNTQQMSEAGVRLHLSNAVVMQSQTMVHAVIKLLQQVRTALRGSYKLYHRVTDELSFTASCSCFSAFYTTQSNR